MRTWFALPRKAGRQLRKLGRVLTLPSILLAAIAALVALSYFIFEPTTVRIAVPAESPADVRLIRAAAELINSQRAAVRFSLVEVASPDEAAGSLEARRSDLAVLRSDMTSKVQAQTVMIVRREAAVIIAPKGGKVTKITDLANVNLGVIQGQKSENLLQQLLDFYKLPQPTGKQVSVAANDVAQALQQKKIDAVLVLGASTSRLVSDVVAQAFRAARDSNFVDIDEASSIARRFPELEEIEVDAGTFGGSPPRPAESLTTVGYSIRLVAVPGLSNDVVADVARQLVATRQSLSATVPGAGLIETPDTDDNSSFVIHPGVKAYVNAERTTLFDRYGDWLYLILIAGSGLGSVIAAGFGWFQTKQRNDALASILKIEKVLEGVRDARTEAKLSELERQSDDIFRVALQKAAQGELGDTQILTFEMAMQEVRMRIAAQRHNLERRKA